MTLKGEVEDEEAEELVAKCPLNVFDIEDMADGYKRAKVTQESKSVGPLCGEIRGVSFRARGVNGGGSSVVVGRFCGNERNFRLL